MAEPLEPEGIPSESHQQRLTEQEHLPEATLVATEPSQEPMTFRPNFSLDLARAPKPGVFLYLLCSGHLTGVTLIETL